MDKPPSSSSSVKESKELDDSRGSTNLDMESSSSSTERCEETGHAEKENVTNPRGEETRNREGEEDPPLPGAYLIQGSSIERAGSGVHLTAPRDESNFRKSSEEPPPSIAVAAELSVDVEAKIEDKVRERLLKETTQASVVMVEKENMCLDKDQYKHRNVKEKLFGDSRGQRPGIAAAPDQYIRKRDLLPWNIQENTTTKDWVARVQTNPKAKDPRDVERSLRFFRAAYESGAFQTGLAMAQPEMQPLKNNPLCYLCQSKFAVFRRPNHCRNCGVCVCAPCSTNWPAKMLPETYLLSKKDSNHVPICLACDWLAREFRQALLDGYFSKALDLHATGNVNLRTPYCLEKKGEVMHPIHMAITSGNMKLIRWLALECGCPLTNSTGGPLMTSKGRSPLQLALSRLDVLQFLVAEKGLPLDGEELDYSAVVAHLSLLLKTVSPKKLLSQQNNSKSKAGSRNSSKVRKASSVAVAVPKEAETERSQRRGSF